MEDEKLETVVIRHDEQIKTICKDVDALKNQSEAIHQMNVSLQLLVEKLGTTNSEISGIKKDIGDLRIDMNDVKTKSDRKDAKKWDKLIWIIIGAVVMAVLGMAFKQIGI